jgi:uncharacterized membrane protein
MRFKNRFCFFLIAILAITSCKKNGTKPNNVSSADVYVAGYTTFGFISPTNIATYWKNGVPTKLTDGTYSSEAYAIAVSGDDVYVVGEYGAFWKNGVATSLPGSVDADAIVVNGIDIYIAGEEMTANGVYVAAYWKNGIAHNLTDGSTNSFARAIAINGDDIYVAGYIKAAGGGYLAAYWKNGVIKMLNDNPAGSYSAAYAITVNGNDVYIAGNNTNINGADGTAILWKNDVATKLQGGDFANAIAVNDNIIYIAGLNGLGGVYWKDGVPTQLTNEGSPFANAMAVNGNDVYLACRTFVNGGVGAASYLKNGVDVQLSKDNVSFAYGIAVVQR